MKEDRRLFWGAEDYGTTPKSSARSSEPERQGNSAALTAGIIIADVVGCGILAMGDAVAKLGWLLGTVVIVALLGMNVHITLLLWRVHRLHPEARTYLELATAAFAEAPPQQLRFVQLVVGGSQHCFIFCALGLYGLSSGQGLGMLFYDSQVCLPFLTLAFCALLLPFNLSARKLGTLSGAIWVNCAATLGAICIPIAYLASQGAEITRSRDSKFLAVADDMNISSAVSALTTCAFAFCGQFIMVEIISEMRDSSEFPKAYVCSSSIQGIAFLFVGLMVYHYRGSEASGMLLSALPFNAVTRLAALCLVTHMLITYVIKSIVLCQSVASRLRESQLIEQSQGQAQWYFIVVSVVTASWLVAQVVPFFTLLVDLLGATFVPLSCFIIPICLFLRCLWDSSLNRSDVSSLELLVLALEIGLSVGLMLVGTCKTLRSIGQQWETFGPPFACHCENMWNSCACSQSRIPECPAGSGVLLSLWNQSASMGYVGPADQILSFVS